MERNTITLSILFLVSLILTNSSFAGEGASYSHLTKGLELKTQLLAAAGWSGAAKIKVAPVPVIDVSTKVDLPTDAETPPALLSLQRTVSVVGMEFPRNFFNGMARQMGIPLLGEKEALPRAMRVIVDAKTKNERILIARTRPDGTVDMVFFAGRPGETETYYSDIEGTLKKVENSRKGVITFPAVATQATAFATEVQAWKAWEVAQNRKATGEQVAQTEQD
jgi:hypothetical protein